VATPKQIAANKANAAKSTGTRTEAGKLKTRDNGMKHALSSRHVILDEEDTAAFDELRAALVSDYKPTASIEWLLIDQIAQNSWRLTRCRTVETATYNTYMYKFRPPDTSPGPKLAYPSKRDDRLAKTFHNNIARFDNLRRHEASIERAYYRAIKQLEAIQKEHRKIASATSSIQTTKSTIGSGLQNAVLPTSQPQSIPLPATVPTQTASPTIEM